MFNELRHEGGYVRFNFGVLAVFLLLMLLFGGASRADVIGQGVMRVAAIVVLVSSALQFDREAFARIRAPAILLACLAAVIGVQLIPVPPDTWAALPGRGVYADALRLAGVAPSWRPISITPDLTLNALLALLPSLASLSLLALLPRRHQPTVLAVLLMAIAISTGIGILQIATGGPYFYKITNIGSAVGSFANRNHSALFVALALPLLGGWVSLPRSHHRMGAVRFWLALCAATVVFPVLLVTGSRGGLLLGVIGIAAGTAILITSPRWRMPRRSRLLSLAIAVALILATAAVFALSSRNEALRRLLAGDESNVRSDLLPTFLRMISDYFPVGSGFGSFNPVYRMYEAHDNLGLAYLNQAHNDWAQILIEGGLPATVLLAVALAWASICAFRAWRTPCAEGFILARTASVMMGMIGISSLFDYPLRTPLMGTMFVVAATWLAQNRERTGAAAG
jgi:O-antigen ligase